MKRPALGALFGFGVGLLLLLLVTMLVRTWSLTDAIRETQQTNTGTVELIKDCTQPDGKCFKDAQKRTSDAVADINKISVYAAACADEPGTQAASDIYACVVQRLADDDAKE